MTNQKLQKLWSDPVWSKVIAGIILGGLGLLASQVQLNVGEYYATLQHSYIHISYVNLIGCVISLVLVGVLILRRVMKRRQA